MIMQSMLGALVGDAAGATLEGRRGFITPPMVEHSISMPGGGVLCVGPGQITDDGELTLCAWRALQDITPERGFPIWNMIEQYKTWYESMPFDIGRTCSLAIEVLSEQEEKQDDDTLLHLKRIIYQRNKSSQANGALMRATAIATWVAPHHDIPAEKAAEFAMEDASLSHPHPICLETNAIYVYTIVNLLRGASPKEAIEYTNEFIVLNDFSPEVKQWYFNESQVINSMLCTEQIGHVRWGFVMAFYFLRHPTISYEQAIRMTLLKGGDTDTNACIVGGMVGCYHSIPNFMRDPIMQFDCTKQGQRRPLIYSVSSTIGHLLCHETVS